MATKVSPSGRPSSRDSTELSVVPAISDSSSHAATSDEPAVEEPWANPAQEPQSSDVSLIEAVEDPLSATRDPDPTGDLAGAPDRAPTEVMRLAFSGMGPPDLEEGAQSLEMRSWHAAAAAGAPERAPPVYSSVFAEVDTQQMKRPASRADTELDPARKQSVDLQALRQDLEEIDRMLRTTKTAAAGLPLESARGLNAQLASVLHRLAEARSKLG